MLLAASSLVSSLVGLVRGKYIAWLFGAGPHTDAYIAAFRLPDLMNNFLVGGAVSITFVTILNRYREKGEEAEGERLLFTVLNLMVLVLLAASIVLMFLAAPFVRYTNPGFTVDQVALCARMTRILLPGQIFLFAGSVLGATLLVRKQFLYQAVTPILYNLSIIGSGILLHQRFGISSLAMGATCGFLLGSLAVNTWGVLRSGIRFRWEIDLHHPGIRMWIFMTVPLMAGFTLPFLDQYFAGYYASHGAGDITRLANAKQLFSAPMSMLAQAAGVASMPFFAQLWAREQRYEFAIGVADCIARDRVGLSGSVNHDCPFAIDCRTNFRRWTIYAERCKPDGLLLSHLCALALCLVSTINLCPRFLCGGDYLASHVGKHSHSTGCIPTLWRGLRTLGSGRRGVCFGRWYCIAGHDVGRATDRRHMVSLASLDYLEMGRCLLAGLLSGSVVWIAIWSMKGPFAKGLFSRLPGAPSMLSARLIDLAVSWLGRRFGWQSPRLSWKNPVSLASRRIEATGLA